LAMSAASHVFLVFEGAWLEVEASLAERRGGLRAFAREAERKWDLEPTKYVLCHNSCKVDSPAMLQRALESACDGTCKLDIIESPEGRVMRSMRVEMKRLEDRVMAKVESALVDAQKQNECQTAKLSSSLAPIVQCMATEQIELRNKLGQLSAQVNDSQRAVVSSEETSCAIKDAEALEFELQQECAMQAACDLDLSSKENLEELRDEVSHLEPKSTCQAERTTASKVMAPQQGHRMTVDSKQAFGYPDAWLQLPSSSFEAIPYSSKHGKNSTAFEAIPYSCKLGKTSTAAPFAQSNAACFNKPMLGHRSCPSLPPLIQ